jgi:putative ABC transport system ATP-binding protein
MTNNNSILIEIQNLTKTYLLGSVQVEALRGVSFQIKQGEYLAIMGPSGSGKSTLMNVIGCLDRPTAGKYILNGNDIDRLDDDRLAHLRNKEIGFVFQTFNLLPRMNALKNAELPLIYSGVPRQERKKIAEATLAQVGLSDRAGHRPSELSGGQQQRVAIARALINKPSILLADEPTGNLDSKSGAEILALFQELHRQGVTIIMVTHDQGVGENTHRIIRLMDGEIVEDKRLV